MEKRQFSYSWRLKSRFCALPYNIYQFKSMRIPCDINLYDHICLVTFKRNCLIFPCRCSFAFWQVAFSEKFGVLPLDMTLTFILSKVVFYCISFSRVTLQKERQSGHRSGLTFQKIFSTTCCSIKLFFMFQNKISKS